jgi:hypothetical protein
MNVIRRLRDKPPCDECRRNFPDITSCSDCVPPLLPSNCEALDVYLMVEGQVITAGMNGKIIGLSLSAVKSAMDIYGVIDQVSCTRKVFAAFMRFLKEKE